MMGVESNITCNECKKYAYVFRNNSVDKNRVDALCAFMKKHFYCAGGFDIVEDQFLWGDGYKEYTSDKDIEAAGD
jgi:hypothetical protein